MIFDSITLNQIKMYLAKSIPLTIATILNVVHSSDILIEDFSNLMRAKSTGSFYLDNGIAMNGKVAIVSFLQGLGFIKAETEAGEAWSYVSSHTAMKLTARSLTDYNVYKYHWEEYASW